MNSRIKRPPTTCRRAIISRPRVGGRPVVIAVLDLPRADDLDHAIHALPIWKLGYSHIVSDLEIVPLRPYENWAEDMKKLSQ
jgi:hypothetical protein